MTELYTIIKDLDTLKENLPTIVSFEYDDQVKPAVETSEAAAELLNIQKDFHRLMVHNVGNVDIPEGVTLDQFNAVMENVCSALEQTEKGESWPYHEQEQEV